jgi:hypothetical protein
MLITNVEKAERVKWSVLRDVTGGLMIVMALQAARVWLKPVPFIQPEFAQEEKKSPGQGQERLKELLVGLLVPRTIIVTIGL